MQRQLKTSETMTSIDPQVSEASLRRIAFVLKASDNYTLYENALNLTFGKIKCIVSFGFVHTFTHILFC